MINRLPLLFALLAASLCSTASFAQQISEMEETAAAPAVDLQKLDQTYGFQDLKFETPVSAVKHLVLVETTGQTKIYRRTTDSKALVNAQVATLLYFFYKGKLTSVRLTTKGYTNSRALLDHFTELYGTGFQANEHTEKRSWTGKKVYLGYEESPLTNDATVYLWSTKMTNQRRADEQKAAQTVTPSHRTITLPRR
ncbi:hypothetical protein [Hymenobacter sp. BT491]|uniref:hypothetical protein n=1 Tax=Hymenobacter sp. BT491 TaxID=2766779 RepID=UPI0016535BCB|nr:hypothetical protein [Hymenobacter sp. BT491]MBC6989545.1 hypothetical protein [Hymenobacter sp. BT491]